MLHTLAAARRLICGWRNASAIASYESEPAERCCCELLLCPATLLARSHWSRVHRLSIYTRAPRVVHRASQFTDGDSISDRCVLTRIGSNCFSSFHRLPLAVPLKKKNQPSLELARAWLLLALLFPQLLLVPRHRGLLDVPTPLLRSYLVGLFNLLSHAVDVGNFIEITHLSWVIKNGWFSPSVLFCCIRISRVTRKHEAPPPP